MLAQADELRYGHLPNLNAIVVGLNGRKLKMSRTFQASAREAISVIEAAYSLEGTDAEWLGRILDAASPDFDSGEGMNAFMCRVGETSLELGPAYVERRLDPKWSERVAELNRTIPDAFFKLLTHSAVLCGGFMEMSLRHAPVLADHLQTTAAATGILDALTIFAQDGEGHAINVGSPIRREVRVHPRVNGIWRRVGVHLASAMRLRRHFFMKDAPREALLEPSGAIAHAEGRVRTDLKARELLSDAVDGVERARTRRERQAPERALEMWRGLVGGEWSLVDHWEQDGRRYLAAYRNRPQVADPRALTRHERLILRFAALGASNKEIAFTLGLSVSSVSVAMSGILQKLGCRRRGDLQAWNDPSRARHASLPIRRGEVGVLSISHALESPRAASLSAAEREIAEFVLRGRTNAQIAHTRGRSPRTIANQIHHMFERLGVGSRAELVRVLTQQERPLGVSGKADDR